MASAIETLFADSGADTLLEQLGEPATQYPLANRGAPVAIQAIVNLGAEGEQAIDDDKGSQVVSWLRLTLPTSITVTVAQRRQTRDEFLVRGLIWSAWKIVAENSALQEVLCRREEDVATKRSRIKG